MHTRPFESCCGLTIIANISSDKPVGGKETAQDMVKRQFLHILKDTATCSAFTRYNSSLVVLNKGQNDAYAGAMKELGYELLKEFENWNEHNQPLYLYFKSGGLKKDLPLPAPKVKDAPPPAASKPTTNR